MIVHNLDARSIAIFPPKANSPLIVYADTPLSGAISGEFFEAICRRDPKILQSNGPIEHSQFPQGNLLNILWQPLRPA
jgi:hypothetical protein